MERIPVARSLEQNELNPAIAEGLREVFSFEQEKFFIDKGGAASVYSLPQGFCVKIIDPRHNSPHKHLFNLGNTVLQEGHFQEVMSGLVTKSTTRTPKLLAIFSNQAVGEKGALVMEKLDAINLEHVLLRRQKLPDTFELESFFDNLEMFVQNMQDNEKIVHGDLFARNVMVDIATGQPRVIDWGRSQYLDMAKNDKGEQKLINDDWNNLNNMYESVKALQM